MNLVPLKPAAMPLTDEDIDFESSSYDERPRPTPTNALSISQALHLWRDGVLREQAEPRLRLGIPSIDRAMRGLQRGEAIDILARTGSGKTHLVNHIVEDMLVQRPTSAVLVCNLEMPCAQLVARLLRRHFKQTDASLEREAQNDTLDVERFTSRLAHLHFLDRGAMSLEQIEQEAADLHRALGPTSLDAIVIDHCGLLRSTRGASAYERATENAIGLKQMARRLNTIVVGGGLTLAADEERQRRGAAQGL